MRLARRCGQRGIIFIFLDGRSKRPSLQQGSIPDYDNRQYQQSHLPLEDLTQIFASINNSQLLELTHLTSTIPYTWFIYMLIFSFVSCSFKYSINLLSIYVFFLLLQENQATSHIQDILPHISQCFVWVIFLNLNPLAILLFLQD